MDEVSHPKQIKIDPEKYNAYECRGQIYCVHKGWILNNLFPTVYSQHFRYIKAPGKYRGTWICELPYKMLKQSELREYCG